MNLTPEDALDEALDDIKKCMKELNFKEEDEKNGK